MSRLCSFYNKEKEGIILENPEIRTLLDEMTQKITSFREVSLTWDQLEEDIAEAENRTGEPGFWDNTETAQKAN